MHRFIADDAALAGVGAGLELRFDQNDDETSRLEPREARRYRLRESDEREIRDHEINEFRHMAFIYGTGVEPFEVDYSRVGQKLRMKLTMPDINRIDPRCAAPDQKVGEPARRCS